MVLFQIIFFAGFITSVKMSSHDNNYCGGDPTKVEIVSPIRCTTLNSKEFAKGTNVFWKNNQLGSCNGKKIDTTNEFEIVFKIVTSSGENFCPKYVTVMIGGAIEYKSVYMDHWHDNSDNYKKFIAKKTSLGSGNFRPSFIHSCQLVYKLNICGTSYIY